MFSPAGTWLCLCRDRRAGEEESPSRRGLTWAREEVSWFCMFLLGAAPSKARRWAVRTRRGAGWYTGAALGVRVGRSWVAEAAGLRAVRAILCEYNQQGLTCDPSCHLKNLHYTEVMLSVSWGYHCCYF